MVVPSEPSDETGVPGPCPSKIWFAVELMRAILPKVSTGVAVVNLPWWGMAVLRPVRKALCWAMFWPAIDAVVALPTTPVHTALRISVKATVESISRPTVFVPVFAVGSK